MYPEYPQPQYPEYPQQQYPQQQYPQQQYPQPQYPQPQYPQPQYPQPQYPQPQYPQPYPPYPTPVYAPPPPRPTMRRRRKRTLPLMMGLLALLLACSVALGAIGLLLAPQRMVQIAPILATQVTGTVYGENLAQREAGRDVVAPLANATVACGGTQASADAHGHYTLLLLRGRSYICTVSAPLYASQRAALSPQFASGFRLDLGPAITTTDGSPADCVLTAAGETCPALALRSGALSGQVINSHTTAPLTHTSVICWDDSAAARLSAQAPARYSGATDARGYYLLANTPPGPYLCVANQQGAPQHVTVTPATTTTLNFAECAAHCAGMSYHAGPVMHTFTAYVIFWAPPGIRFEPDGSNAQFQSLVSQYLTDVGGTSFYGLLTQYWDQQGPVRNVSTLGGSYLDTQPYPHAGTRADPLSDDDITAEINRVRALKGWEVTASAAFIVLTGYNVEECAKFSDGQSCSFPSNANNGFCAYHSFAQNTGNASSASSTEYYPYLYVANNTDCVYLPTFDSGAAPYGDQTADAVINSLSHEQFETVTDPLTLGWYDGDPSGGEIGDKCETNFGPTNADGSTVTLNHGNSYALQEEYSNLAGGCAYQ